MANKNYPRQFKADAVALYRSRPGASIADDLGVNRETLRSWVRALTSVAVPGRVRPGRWRRPVRSRTRTPGCEAARELEEERDILRKAARYFAGETRW